MEKKNQPKYSHREDSIFPNMWQKIGRWGYFALIGFLLCRVSIGFGAAPCGMALLCATGGSTLAVYIGLCLATIGWRQGLILFLGYTFTLLLRMLFGLSAIGIQEKGNRITFGAVAERIFCTDRTPKVICAAFGALFVGVWKFYMGGFMYYDLIGTVLAVSVAALAAGIWSLLDDKDTNIIGLQGVWE